MFPKEINKTNFSGMSKGLNSIWRRSYLVWENRISPFSDTHDFQVVSLTSLSGIYYPTIFPDKFFHIHNCCLFHSSTPLKQTSRVPLPSLNRRNISKWFKNWNSFSIQKTIQPSFEIDSFETKEVGNSK